MAALHAERCTYSRPFSVTGADFAGPFEIQNYSGRACLITKGYVCLFVCFSHKAIHLELTNNLSSDSFLAAFARFVSRRGCPRKMVSDNGTTFVGASASVRRELKRVIKDSADLAQRQYAYQGLSLEFIPAGAPHMGGLWEAGVKSFKTHFKKVASKFKYTFEEMSTLLCRIEACLNSRQLCLNDDTNNDSPSLTPGQLLGGFPLLSPAEETEVDQSISILNRWSRIKALSQQFALRWKKEYLKELHKRNKWQFPSKNIEVDDVVVKHENLPPTEWRLDGQRRQSFCIPSTFPGYSTSGSTGSRRLLVNIPLVPPIGPLKPKWSCALCKKHHLLRFCRRFKGLDYEHRLRAIVKHGCCMKCLCPTQSTRLCRSSMKCPRCNADHNYLLHDDGKEKTPNRKARSIISRSARNSVRTIQTMDTPAEVLLPTCQLAIWYQGQQVRIRALIDQCSERNFILRNLPSARECFNLPAAEGQDVELALISVNGSHQRRHITARVTNRLRRAASTFYSPPFVKGHFENSKLADDNFDQPSPLQKILGMPVYYKIMRATILSQRGFPQVQDSIFGWVLYGICNL